jgi:hypothetical protein
MDGDGIIIAEKPADVVWAPLYTKFVPIETEYRIHAMAGSAFYSNRKAKARSNADERIRTTSGGWYFKHQEALPSYTIQNAAAEAVSSLNLAFGGVDVGVDKDGNVFVFEVNTAPEMGPNTTAAYKKQFIQHYGYYKNKDGNLLSGNPPRKKTVFAYYEFFENE